ncbi:MAG TPA: phosphomannomutase [Deltaproteobacteria bacterium]|nr:phosphomannomutase [Deltaproteobacteria bacterium]
MVNFDVFRAYDVRGVYPTDIDEPAYYRIAQGYVYTFRPKVVVVGADARLSSPSLKNALISGLLDAGVDVVDIGNITTDMLYFATGAYGYSGGIIVSASHNPGQYNGIKMVREGVTAISSDTGLLDIRDALMAQKDMSVSSAKKGSLRTKEVIGDYVKHVLGFVHRASIKKLTFVGNANFGFVGKSVTPIAKELNLNLIPLNFEPDGSFPKGPPDPMLAGNRSETERLVRESKADFGAAWDADADRVMFFDETGAFVSGVYMTALLATIMLNKHGTHNKILYDPRVVWPVEKAVSRIGGEAIMSKSGHAFMKDRLRSEDALFAGELSAHYFFRDNFYADNGVIPLLLLLEHLSETEMKLSEVMRPFVADHYMTGELNYRVADMKTIIGHVKERFGPSGKEDFTDGYSVESSTWRFNIRPSNTEPYLRLNVEARSPEALEEMRVALERIIEG